jgi:excisionase family DNA binding protein
VKGAVVDNSDSVVTRTFERLLSKKQVADALGLSQRSVDRLVATRRMPLPLRFGRTVRWRPSDIAAYLERSAAASAG